MQTIKKACLSEVEEEIYSKRRTVRYDIRDMTVEAISEKYNDSLDSSDGEHTKKSSTIFIYLNTNGILPGMKTGSQN